MKAIRGIIGDFLDGLQRYPPYARVIQACGWWALRDLCVVEAEASHPVSLLELAQVVDKVVRMFL